MRPRPTPAEYSATVSRRIRELRKRRGWTVQHLVDQLATSGFPLGRVTVSKMENGKRDQVTVDELYAFAAVFGVPVDELAHDGARCPTCKDEPPTGFRCLACGAV